jgi:uncharacterized protein (DUF433 family)
MPAHRSNLLELYPYLDLEDITQELCYAPGGLMS